MYDIILIMKYNHELNLSYKELNIFYTVRQGRVQYKKPRTAIVN